MSAVKTSTSDPKDREMDRFRSESPLPLRIPKSDGEPDIHKLFRFRSANSPMTDAETAANLKNRGKTAPAVKAKTQTEKDKMFDRFRSS